MRKSRNGVAERVQALADAGMSQSDAARELGVSRQAVSDVVRRHGITFTGGLPRGSTARHLRALASAGNTPAEAARITGTSRANVCGISKRHGIAFTARGKPGPRKAP